MNLAVSYSIRSLAAAQAIQAAKKYAKKYGVQAFLTLLQMHTQWRDGRASKEQEQAFKKVQEVLPRLLDSVQAREVIVIPGAFNSSPVFTDYFQAAALGAILLVLLDVASAIKAVGQSLEGIRSELAISNISRVQGWGDGGFGGYVHRFVQNEMTVVYGADNQHHFFYVWHPDSDWYPAFEGRQREEPLGSAFGGYHHELATICLRMRADREALVATT